MSLQEEELVSSHAGQPEQASSLLDCSGTLNLAT